MQFRQAQTTFNGTKDKKSYNQPSFVSEAQKYLRFWGVDYPYLSVGTCGSLTCLPVPTGSDFHKMVNDYHRLTSRVGLASENH